MEEVVCVCAVALNKRVPHRNTLRILLVVTTPLSFQLSKVSNIHRGEQIFLNASSKKSRNTRLGVATPWHLIRYRSKSWRFLEIFLLDRARSSSRCGGVGRMSNVKAWSANFVDRTSGHILFVNDFISTTLIPLAGHHLRRRVFPSKTRDFNCEAADEQRKDMGGVQLILHLELVSFLSLQVFSCKNAERT